MPAYTYRANVDPAERTSKLVLRGGSLVVEMGHWANFTPNEWWALKGRYVLEPGTDGLPAQQELKGTLRFIDLSDVPVLEDGQTIVWSDHATADGGGLVARDTFGVLPAFSAPGDLTVRVGKMPYLVPRSLSLQGALAVVSTPPQGTNILIDINVNGATIFTTPSHRVTIAPGQRQSALAIPDVRELDPGDVITVDIDQVGSTVSGADLGMTLVAS